MPVTTTGSWRAAATISKTVGALTPSEELIVTATLALSAGTGINAADRAYYTRQTIAGSGTLSLDVSGSLLDIYGDAFIIARLKLLVVKSDLTLCPNVIDVTMPTNGVPWLGAAADLIHLRPGGSLVWYAPDATAVVVTAGTGDLINFVNTAAGNVQPEILIVGSSV